MKVLQLGYKDRRILISCDYLEQPLFDSSSGRVVLKCINELGELRDMGIVEVDEEEFEDLDCLEDFNGYVARVATNEGGDQE